MLIVPNYRSFHKLVKFSNLFGRSIPHGSKQIMRHSVIICCNRFAQFSVGYFALKSKPKSDGVLQNASLNPTLEINRGEYMKKFSLMFLSVMMFWSAFFVGTATPAAAKETRILAFDTMVGVPHSLTG